jgi:hypothetical protein
MLHLAKPACILLGAETNQSLPIQMRATAITTWILIASTAFSALLNLCQCLKFMLPNFPLSKKYGCPPSLSSPSDDGSRDSIGGILEQNDGILFDDLHQDDDSVFYMEAQAHVTTPASKSILY